jgi:signal transduction histidine kinase
MNGERVSILAHELRSPVAALAAIAEAVSARGQAMGDDEKAHLIALAVGAGRDIERLVLDPEMLSLEPQRLDVEMVVRSVAPAGVSVDVPHGLVVEADPVRLRQVLTNLVGNAQRHGRRVEVTAREVGGTLRIAVVDDGRGVETGLDVFASGVSGAGSTGYGLAVARGIARAHGGDIELESSPGAGATFTLVLPSSAEP